MTWNSSQDSSLANVMGLQGTEDPGGEGRLRWMLALHLGVCSTLPSSLLVEFPEQDAPL